MLVLYRAPSLARASTCSTSIDRLDRNLLHQRGNKPAADLDALLQQQVAQHPAVRKRKLVVQLVDPPHDRQIGRRSGPWQAIRCVG